MKLLSFVAIISTCAVVVAEASRTGTATRRLKGYKKATAVTHRYLQEDATEAPTEEPDGKDKDKDDEGPDLDLSTILGIACFSDRATVQVKVQQQQQQQEGNNDDKTTNTVSMKDLQLGDKVWNGQDFSPVYAFGHYNPNVKGVFLQIHTTTSTTNNNNAKSGERKPLEMTAGHLVYLEGQSYPVRADSLSIGDSLHGEEAGFNSTTNKNKHNKVVTKIKKVERLGLYTPFTIDGTLMVDGIKTSSYVSLQAGKDSLFGVAFHDYIHKGMSPMRLLCMGVSSDYCSTENADGMPFYVWLSIRANQWIFRQNLVVQVMLLSCIFLLTGASAALESILGPSLAPVFLLLSLVTVLLGWKKQSAKQKQL